MVEPTSFGVIQRNGLLVGALAKEGARPAALG
jgi:hypothetical protein